MSKHRNKTIKIHISLTNKFTERLLIAALLLSHLAPPDLKLMDLDTHKVEPKGCTVHQGHVLSSA